MRKFVWAGIMLATVSAEALAQPALPVCKRPVYLGELMEALRTNDRSILNADCKKIVEAFNATFKLPADEQPKSCEEFAQYLERLNVTEAPAGAKASFTRIMRDGRIDLYGFSRPARLKEDWAYDNQMGLWTMSMYCCNFISRNELPIPRQHTEVAAAMPADKPLLATTAIAPQVQNEQLPSTAAADTSVGRPSDHPWWHWKRKSGKTLWLSIGGAALGGGIYCAVETCGRTTVTVTQTVTGR